MDKETNDKSKLEKQSSERGFVYYDFSDVNGNSCSIQKSSSAMEDRIWLGCNEIGLKRYHPNTEEPWREIKLEYGEYIANNRMHLNREQIKKLLPILQKFVETGEI